MSDEKKGTPASEDGLTLEELREIAAQAAKGAVSAELKDAIAEVSTSQKGILEMLTEAEARKAVDGKPDLGEYPLGRKIRALAMAALESKAERDNPEAAIHAIKKSAGWPTTVAEPTIKWLEHVKTTLTAGTAATAGDIIMPAFDPEWIELLRVNAVVRGFARTIPMPRGATSRRKQTQAGTAYYQGETDTMTASNQKVGRANLSYKKLTAETVISNDLIRFSGGDADMLVQDDLLQVVALREDRAFLFGNPPTDAGSPKGIRYQMNQGTQPQAAAGATLANYQSDLPTKLISSVEEANVIGGTDDFKIIMSVASFWKIYSLVTTVGDWVFASGLNNNPPRLLSFPVLKARYMKEATLAADGYGTSGSAGQILFVHAPSCEIHDSLQRTVGIWPGGAYYDASSGVVKSGISQDETVITCIAEHDFLLTHDVAASALTGYAT